MSQLGIGTLRLEASENLGMLLRNFQRVVATEIKTERRLTQDIARWSWMCYRFCARLLLSTSKLISQKGAIIAYKWRFTNPSALQSHHLGGARQVQR